MGDRPSDKQEVRESLIIGAMVLILGTVLIISGLMLLFGLGE